jgi:hypothetical protein
MERDLQKSVYFRLHSQFTICQNPNLFTGVSHTASPSADSWMTCLQVSGHTRNVCHMATPKQWHTLRGRTREFLASDLPPRRIWTPVVRKRVKLG